MKKHLLVMTFAVTLVLLGTYTVSRAYAADQTAQDTLVSRIAEKFSLNKADVQAVFDQFHSERQTAKEAKYEEYLSGLVKNGKITEAQKTLLIAKRQELLAKAQTDRSQFQNLTPEQRKAQRKAELKALQDWGTQNHIDLKYLFHAGGKKMFHLGYRMGRMK